MTSWIRIRWALRVVVDLPCRLDPRLTLPLLGVTAPLARTAPP